MRISVDAVRYRPWQAGDDQLLGQLGPALSHATLYTRFLAGTPTLPGYYLRYLRTAPAARWDAVVALHGSDVVGWAEIGRLSDWAPEGELAVVVVDAWHRRGIGSSLARSVIQRAVLTGLNTVVADVLAENIASVRLVESLAGGVFSVAREGELLHFTLPLAGVAAVA